MGEMVVQCYAPANLQVMQHTNRSLNVLLEPTNSGGNRRMTGALQRQVVPGPGARGSAWARRLGAYNICIGLRSPGQLGLGFCEIVRRDWLNESKRYVGAISKATLTKLLHVKY